MTKFKELLCFGIIGGVGFLVDSGILYLLRPMSGVYFGRLISFLCAVATTWFLNRLFTFRQQHSGKSVWHEVLTYTACMVLGGLVNYGVYWFLVSRYEQVYQYPILGVAAGSLAGMIFNYATARMLVFNKNK